MMTKTDSTRPVQDYLFRVMLCDLVAKDHELVLLSDAIDWKRFEKALEPAYSSDKGRPSVPIRMIAGLTFLKYMFAMIDQDVLDNWCENPCWQYFCGGEFFEHRPPTDQATMSRRRSRSGEAGAKEMIMETLASALRSKVARKKDFERVNVDTTVQEKNIRFPTDARTLDRARERVVATGERLGVRFSRNSVRVASGGGGWQFRDMVDDKEKWREYAAADLLVHPSVSENFGITIAEGLAAGLPVICTKGTPWSDIEVRKCGWWIDVGVDSLVTALRSATSLTEDERGEMGKRGRKLVEEKYTWEAVCGKMVEGYESILNHGIH